MGVGNVKLYSQIYSELFYIKYRMLSGGGWGCSDNLCLKLGNLRD